MVHRMFADLPRYWIPPHVRVCPLLASTILLDLKRNRYFGIGARETRALSTLALNWNEASGAGAEVEPLTADAAIAMAGALIDAGLLSREPPADRASFRGIPPDLGGALTSAGHELSRETSLRVAHVAAFLGALAWTRRALRSRSLYAIACEVRDRKVAAGETFDAQQAIELVGLFRRLRPHTFAARDRCLFHSLALVRFMSRHAVFPTWVIGVRAKPWGAHAWVQQEKLLLDANPEHVCEYTPILTV
ncbi:MAG TPA: lasso peptide biosynthesis B2 protein [Steroidobacteraceae bacterium]|jgi:transglutaminase superfamily protein|nr:lasso peptide biosynthesis B2 protein [Steroidobacteraceae bacterium]